VQVSFYPVSFLQEALKGVVLEAMVAEVGFSLDRGQVVSSAEAAALAAVGVSAAEAAHSVEEGLQEAGDARTSEIGKILY